MTTQYDLLKRLIQRQKQPTRKPTVLKGASSPRKKCCMCGQTLHKAQQDICGFCCRIFIAIKMPKLKKLKDRAFAKGKIKVGRILLQAVKMKEKEINRRGWRKDK